MEKLTNLPRRNFSPYIVQKLPLPVLIILYIFQFILVDMQQVSIVYGIRYYLKATKKQQLQKIS